MNYESKYDTSPNGFVQIRFDSVKYPSSNIGLEIYNSEDLFEYELPVMTWMLDDGSITTIDRVWSNYTLNITASTLQVYINNT